MTSRKSSPRKQSVLTINKMIERIFFQNIEKANQCCKGMCHVYETDQLVEALWR